MIPLEKVELAAWMMGGIMLSSPSGFLVCMHTRTIRKVVLDFSEAYLEGKVIAIVPPICACLSISLRKLCSCNSWSSVRERRNPMF